MNLKIWVLNLQRSSNKCASKLSIQTLDTALRKGFEKEIQIEIAKKSINSGLDNQTIAMITNLDNKK